MILLSDQDRAAVMEVAAQVDAKQGLLPFMRYLWRRPMEPLQVGPHTEPPTRRRYI